MKLVIAGFMLFTAGCACAQQYPSRPVRIVTSEAGGGADFSTRVIAQALSVSMGQQFIVDNKGSLIAIETAAKASPDGYVLTLASNPMWLLPLMQDVSFDTLRDFAPIVAVSSTPMLVVVYPSVPATSVRELIALAKAKPGQLNYASGSLGSSTQLAGELFKSMAGVNIAHIPYKGSGPAINDLIAGHVQLMFGTSGVVPHVKSGRLRALAVTSPQPSALFPGMPTVNESGVPGYQSVAIFGLFAPAKTPDSVINKLSQEVTQQLKNADVRERFLKSGSDPGGGTADEFTGVIKSEIVRLGKVIKDGGIRAE